ncbi:MAG: hypothetical protein LBS99_04690 [Clostridiales bacterium]|jgi:hypothetical protein|nr:hypothetical protein [Clostridiales bacterium]
MNEQPEVVFEDKTAVTECAGTDGAVPETETDGSLGKFRTPEALYKAYLSLETEFTKKCQRLAGMENAQNGRESERSAPKTAETPTEECAGEKAGRGSARSAPKAAETPTEECAGEKAGRGSAARGEDITGEFRASAEQFFREYPESRERVEEIAAGLPDRAGYADLLNAYIKLLRTQEKSGADERNAAIVEYLKEKRTDARPPKVLTGGGGFNMLPPRAPSSIKEAGEIAGEILGRR